MSELTRPASDECAVDYVTEQYLTKSLTTRARRPQVMSAKCQFAVEAATCAGLATLTTGEVEIASETRLIPCIARFMRELGKVTTGPSLDQSLLCAPDIVPLNSMDL